MKVLVYGGRDYKNRQLVFDALDTLCLSRKLFWMPDDGNWIPTITLMHGACPTGADRFADDWAVARYCDQQQFPADWDRFKKSAGPKRNQLMADHRPEVALQFPGNRGTRDMRAKLEALDYAVEILEFT